MPLTEFQRALAIRLAENRSSDSYLAGGAALHFAPNSKRYSNDLDYFQDSEERVAEAFAQDAEVLRGFGCSLTIEMNQPGYIKATVARGGKATKIEWAHDSAWRFMPTVQHSEAGFLLHPIDLAVNKVLALVGRDEARDYLDVLHVHEEVLPLGALVWAASGKDPGFTPSSLLELLKRRGKYRQEDFNRLHLTRPIILTNLKSQWLRALEEAAEFISSRPASEVGCLYYSSRSREFVQPSSGSGSDRVYSHYGRPGGVLPEFVG